MEPASPGACGPPFVFNAQGAASDVVQHDQWSVRSAVRPLVRQRTLTRLQGQGCLEPDSLLIG